MSARGPIGVDFQEERFSDLRIEGARLFELHWQEAGHRMDEPVDMDWSSYRAMEDAQRLLTVTARTAGKLIGYAVYIIWRHPHHRGICTAQNDAWFIDPAYRRGPIGRRLVERAEALMAQRGVSEIMASIRPINRMARGERSLTPLMHSMGYRLISLGFSKVLGHG
jgi:GNAT superfamily N-acetyltransferase